MLNEIAHISNVLRERDDISTEVKIKTLAEFIQEITGMTAKGADMLAKSQIQKYYINF